MVDHFRSPRDRQAPWAVVLAGGDGTHLRSLTFQITGDLRPKQFCSVFGGNTLLSQTWQRLAPLFHRNHTISVFTRVVVTCPENSTIHN
jgi:mannose-1-phosphate guanylyltransferase